MSYYILLLFIVIYHLHHGCETTFRVYSCQDFTFVTLKNSSNVVLK